jgi:hypothetical protein
MTPAHHPPRGVRFDRQAADAPFAFLGDGEPGGKAAGLALIKEDIARRFPAGRFHELGVDIPRMTVLRTGVFEEFVAAGGLRLEELAELSDEQVARHFQKAELPAPLVGDLLALISRAHEPLAIRSSSLLEDALYEPFAGVYATKMIPNNQPDADSRFRKLVEAVKFVFASTWFRGPRDYCRATGHDLAGERMAVIVQEVVGYRFRQRFYPTVSGVARSYTFYPLAGCRRQEGVAHLALGLGKTVVEGGAAWSFCPSCPRTPPPYRTLRELAKNTQTRYWAVNLAQPAEYNPTKENEYLVRGELREAEEEGSLRYVCSTWDPSSDRLTMGLAGEGPRLLDFSPLLQGGLAPLPELIGELLALAKGRLGGEVEIEFAMAFDPLGARPSRFGFLQLRPLAVRTRSASIEGIEPERVLVRSRQVIGGGEMAGLQHIVYVKPQSFGAEATAAIAAEVAEVNARLLAARQPYVLVGFGRWGSADPWLGIPVAWSQIAGARAIVEASLPEMNPEPSQGSHFFHNISSLGIPYFTVQDSAHIAWEALERLPVVEDLKYVRHVVSPAELRVLVDGTKGEGVIVR